MSSSRKSLVALALALAAGAVAAQGMLQGLGRVATPKEIAAWDIDVRPDFKGLPKGSGSVAQGQDIWETKCASCHGIFGESNQVFTPLVGGTTADDVKTGRVARLLDPAFPGRTTLMKVGTVSTLWDYIHRAMPWNQPKSLKPDEVYAVTAFLLNLADVLPENFVLSDQTMAQAQARMPNRNGMNTTHGMWPGKGLTSAKAPDVKAVACMSNCAVEPKVASLLPDFARNNHGNLAEQNRMVGAQHGVDTTRPSGAAPAKAEAPAAPAPAKPAAGGAHSAALALLTKHSCVVCHAVDSKLVGPSFKEVSTKHGTRADALAYLAAKIKSGGVGVWGQIPMPPQALSDDDANLIARWLVDGARR
jgi:cytochrome c